MDLSHWSSRARRFSHESNLLLAAMQRLSDVPADHLEAELPKLLAGVGGVRGTKIKMSSAQIRRTQESAPHFVVDMLLVRLEAEIHGHIKQSSGHDPSKDSLPLETLCAGVERNEDFKQLILLSCIRNAIVHGDGRVRWPRISNRLIAAGWSDGEFAALARATAPPRSLNDLLFFKKVARSVVTQWHLARSSGTQSPRDDRALGCDPDGRPRSTLPSRALLIVARPSRATGLRCLTFLRHRPADGRTRDLHRDGDRAYCWRRSLRFVRPGRPSPTSRDGL